LADVLEVLTASITLMAEASSTSETSINFYQTTWCNIPEDSHLKAHQDLWDNFIGVTERTLYMENSQWYVMS
jgi:hypothetical protein